MKKLILALALCLAGTLLIAPPVLANWGYSACDHRPNSAACAGRNEVVGQTQLGARTRTVLNTVYSIVGILAVIFIVVAGIRYTTSGGDPAKTKAAQQTLTYAIVGLIVAALAFAITHFVIRGMAGAN